MESNLQLSRARQIWPYLVDAATKKEKITYKDLGQIVNVHPRALRFALLIIKDKCSELLFPPITSLVINSQTRLPGRGNQIPEELLSQTLNEIYEFNWRNTNNPFAQTETDNTNAWWLNDPNERYWMESTDRKDLGKNLIAPISQHAGQKLVSYVEDGDIILHYHQERKAIVAISMAKGTPFESEIRWPDRKVSPKKPAFEIDLAFFTELEEPISLEEIHSKDIEIRKIREDLTIKTEGKSVYFPFQVPNKTVIQPAQGAYLSKVPLKMFELFPELINTINLQLPPEIVNSSTTRVKVIKPQRRVNQPRTSGQGRETDPERKIATEKHAMKLAREYLIDKGFSVEDVSMVDGLGYDLHASKEDYFIAVEVKGSRSRDVSKVDLTKSEVDYAQNAKSLGLSTLLIVVDCIITEKVDGVFLASAGNLRIWEDWDAHESLLVAKTFSYSLPEID